MLEGASGERYFETSIYEAIAQGKKGSQRGPVDITATVSKDGEVLGTKEFMPDYIHSSDFWGDESCGYCEYLQGDIEMLISP